MVADLDGKDICRRPRGGGGGVTSGFEVVVADFALFRCKVR